MHEDTDHPIRHPSVTLGFSEKSKGEQVTHVTEVNLGADKTPDWAGATPLCAHIRAQRNSWGRSSPTAR